VSKKKKYAHLYVHTISQANLTGDFRSETPKRAFFAWEMPTKSKTIYLFFTQKLNIYTLSTKFPPNTEPAEEFLKFSGNSTEF
jgi:hypothetical protein